MLLVPDGDDGNNDPIQLETIVTNGATQALSLACTTLLDEGDEAVLLEPAFDIYKTSIMLAGATPVYIPMEVSKSVETQGDATSNGLNKNDDSHVGLKACASLKATALTVDLKKLAAVLNERTKMLILNSPHNPKGKVFTIDELRAIAELLDEHAPNCTVLSDEVYEHLVYNGRKHVPFASVSPSAHARTVSIYRAGKTFSATGLKIGWAIGPKNVMRDLLTAQQFIVFSVSHWSGSENEEVYGCCIQFGLHNVASSYCCYYCC